MGHVVELKPATIAKLELEPDDVVVVRSSERISAALADEMSQQIRASLPFNNRVILLAPNLSIEVMGKRR